LRIGLPNGFGLAAEVGMLNRWCCIGDVVLVMDWHKSFWRRLPLSLPFGLREGTQHHPSAEIGLKI